MPLVNKTFNQLIDFTRTSAATYVDASGRIVPTPASRNLLTFTQEFDNAAWTKVAATVTANAATAPDGTLTGDLLIPSTASSAHYAAVTATVVTATTYTYSCYVKANGYSKVGLRENAATGAFATFDLSTGTVFSQAGGGTGSISSVGNGWFRISMTSASSGTSFIGAVYALDSGYTSGTPFSYTYTGDGTSGIYLWGAQLEAVPDANLVLGSELRSAGATQLAGTATAATYNTSTGVGSVTRVDGSNQSSVGWTGLNDSARYRIDIDNTGANPITMRSGSATGSAPAAVLAGQRVTIHIQPTGGAITITSGAGTANFTVHSFREITAITGMPTDYTRNNGGVYPPRFDYDPVTLAPKGLLIEEQRTNLLTYSEQFDNAAWTKQNVTATANSTTSPYGTVDADSVVENTAADVHRIQQSATVTNGTAYAISVFAKPIGSRRLYINSIAVGGAGALFDLSGDGSVVNVAGTAANKAATIQAVGNGWYRCTLIGTGTGTASAILLQVNRNTSTTASDDVYTGDGTSGLYIWGAQLEAGSFATSYIPTVASQVTRTADVATITGANFSQWYNQSEGTFVVEASCFGLGKSLSDGFVAATNGTAAENISIYRTGSANNVQSSIRDNNADQVTYTVALGTQPVKAALAYATNNSNSAQGGVAQTTDTTCTIPTVDRLLIGSIYAAGDYPTNGHIRSIKYFPVRLSNAQLQALTA